MADTAALQAQLDELRRAYNSGASEISYDGKRVLYRDDLRAVIAAIESELGLSTSPRSVVIRSEKGW